MSKQEFSWMLGLMVAWRQNDADDDQDGSRMVLRHVYAQAGSFSCHTVESSNDELAAVLFILALIFHQTCAKYIANLIVLALLLRKINAARIFVEAAANPRPTRPAALWLGLIDLCHFDHLPTTLRQLRTTPGRRRRR